MRERYKILMLLATVAIIYTITLSVRKDEPVENIMKPKPQVAGPKRYVIYSKKQFEKQIGSAAVPLSTYHAFANILGAKNIQPLELINGATFEADKEIDTKKINAMLAHDSEFEIQEEYTHSILGAAEVAETLYRLVPVSCAPTQPGPRPPPGPPPVQPPTPNPSPGPIESDKSWGRTRVHAKDAQNLVDTSLVKVCVIDTGIDLQHPNKGNVIGSVGFAGAVQDGAGHGTHTAGTIAGTGGVGISKAQLLICKGLSDGGSGSSSSLAQCLTWCGSQGSHIVNNSWGSGQQDPMINQAIAGLTQKGIAVVVSNGNDGRGTLNWPAQLAVNNPLVFGSAASDQRDQRANFSTYGPGTKFISPGVDIVSNKPGGGTVAMSGTSMSAPHLSGIMAFCIAKGLPPSCVKSSGQVGGYPFADAALTAQ